MIDNHHQDNDCHLPNILWHSALAGDVPLQLALQAVRVVLLATPALHLINTNITIMTISMVKMVRHNHLPFLLVHLVLDLVGRGDCEAPRAGDHVPLLQEPKGVVETLTMTIVMISIIISRTVIIKSSVIIKHDDHIIDLFTICGENFSIRGQENSSEPHQVLF